MLDQEELQRAGGESISVLTLLFSTKALNRVMGQEEIVCNTVIDMLHKIKQVTSPPLLSEVPVIKRSYPGMKRRASDRSCFNFL